MIKMLQYKMYPAGELRCPTTALVIHEFQLSTGSLCNNRKMNKYMHETDENQVAYHFCFQHKSGVNL